MAAPAVSQRNIPREGKPGFWLAVDQLLRTLASTWVVGVVALAPVIPVAAMGLTVGFYISLEGNGLETILAITVPTALVLCIFGPLPAGSLSTAERANRSSYDEFIGRYESLRRRIEVLCAKNHATHELACLDASAFFEVIHWGHGASLRWALRTGYVDLWMSLHRAEEALIDIEPREALLRHLAHDELRLDGSQIPQRADMNVRLNSVQKDLSSTEDQEAKADTKVQLREVRRSINEFRDGRWEAIVRMRNTMNVSVLCAGIAAYALLALAIIRHVDRAELTAAAVFYLVGAVAGFFHGLYRQQKTERTVDDYGLSSSLLYQTLMFSGLAAVGGLVVIAMLPAALNDLSAIQANGPAAQIAYPALNEVFDIGKNPFRLVIAAVFGLSPEILIAILKQQGKELQAQIKSTEPGEGVSQVAATDSGALVATS